MSMPTRGAIYLTNGRRKHKRSNGRKSKRARSASPFARVIARLNSGRKAKRKNRGHGRRKNATRLYNRRRNSIALRENRGRGRRKNSRRMNRRPRHNRRRNSIALRENRGRGRKHNRRRNSIALRENRGRRHNRRKNATRLYNGRRHNRRRNSGYMTKASGLARKIPFVGKYIGDALPGALFGALGLIGVHMAYKHLGRFIPGVVKGYIAPVGYTVGGMVLGAAVHFIPASVISASTKKSLQGAMVLGGAAVDAFRYFTGKSRDLGDDGFGALAMGDGGLWQLGDSGMGDPEGAALQAAYGDAQPGDAMHCGGDLDATEGEAALAGPRMWHRRFPMAQSATRTQGSCSRHAAKHGHRWGWLCKMVGWSNFQRLVALPPAQRVNYIQRLKEQAIALIPGQAPALLPTGPQLIIESGDTQPLGALMYAGY